MEKCGLEIGMEIELEPFIAFLEAAGYLRSQIVEVPGQFTMRGGIIDVFSPASARPVRIELFGEVVESIREFNPRTQRSTAAIARTLLYPMSSYNYSQVAFLFSTSENTIRKLVEAGDLKGLGPSDRRISARSIDAFVANLSANSRKRKMS